LDYDRYMKEFRVLLKNREQPAVVRVPPGGTLEQDDSATVIKDEKGNTVGGLFPARMVRNRTSTESRI